MKDFRGQVKIEDVQNAFNELVGGINNAIDKYNDAENTLDYSLDVGGNYLAPENYTLSIGGLKRVLGAYDGAVLGCHVWRIGTNKFAVTNGIYIKNNTATRMNQGIITGDSNGKFLYYDKTNSVYVSSTTKLNDETRYIYIRNINLKRDMILCDTSTTYAINPDLKIFSGDNASDVNSNEYTDASRPCFISATGGGGNSAKLLAPIYFLGVEVKRNHDNGIHQEKFAYPYYPIFYLPKGVANPFSSDYPCYKVFTATEEN